MLFPFDTSPSYKMYLNYMFFFIFIYFLCCMLDGKEKCETWDDGGKWKKRRNRRRKIKRNHKICEESWKLLSKYLFCEEKEVDLKDDRYNFELNFIGVNFRNEIMFMFMFMLLTFYEKNRVMLLFMLYLFIHSFFCSMTRQVLLFINKKSINKSIKYRNYVSLKIFPPNKTENFINELFLT